MTRNLLVALTALSGVWCTTALGQAVPAPIPATAPVPPQNSPVAQTQETLSARTLVRLEQLTRELSETVGRVEALEGNLAAQKAETDRLATLLDLSRAEQSASDMNATVPAEVTSDTAPLAIAAPAPTPQSVSALTPTIATAQETVFTTPMPPPLSPAIMLTNAQTALQSGSYPVAEANLTQLIWVHPVSAEASEGRWLLGEARFVQAAWGTAAQAYVDYLKVSPQGPRASEALLRLAGTFRQLGDNRQRCLALTEFKRRAPRPDATLKARADGEIARMTCPPA